ncbi:MAG: type III pantothenate kinase [Phycisphaerales bacterium]|nr:type III pantothenate kinase [Phycisphaerales bacterium]
MPELPPSSHSVLAVALGNTRARWAAFRAREMGHAHAEPFELATPQILQALEEAAPDLVAIASVNEPAAGALEAAIRDAGIPVVRVGRDCLPPLNHTLDDASTLGVDRALDAVAAFSLVESACVVVDAGTAITVDFIDGQGTFHGGAIAPGLNMMLRALHEHTAALPEIRFEPQDLARGPFGKDTRHAMQLGVVAGAVGMVRQLVERYAEHYEAYPRVIATGGDAPALFDDDGLVERIIPDLQLIGIQRTIEHALREGDEEA